MNKDIQTLIGQLFDEWWDIQKHYNRHELLWGIPCGPHPNMVPGYISPGLCEFWSTYR